jgi:hypothetical protein
LYSLSSCLRTKPGSGPKCRIVGAQGLFHSEM